MGLLDRLLTKVEAVTEQARAPAPSSAPAVPSTFYQWPTLQGATDDFGAVGENNYQEALHAAAGGKTPEGPLNRWVTAQLVAEPTNKHDRRAVMVALDGRCVGYIPRDSTSPFHKVIQQLAGEGRPATCRAVITGGWWRSPTDEGHYGIKLDVDERAPQIMYAGQPFLPKGGVVTIGERQKHTNNWEHLVRRDGSVTQLIATLAGPDDDGRVLVELDGKRIGRLTASVTERFEPWLTGTSTAGIQCTCEAVASMKGDKPEIALNLRKP